VPRAPAPAPQAAPAATPALKLSEVLDTVDGLRRCMGNLDLYRRLLRGFDKTHGDFDRQLHAALQAGHNAETVQLVHSLRGLAGNIGAPPLALACTRLEARCQAALPVPSNAPEVQELLRLMASVLGDIGLLTGNADPSDASTSAHSLQATSRASAQALSAWWAELEQLICGNDASAPEVLQALLDAEPGAQAWPEHKPLLQALQQYDFDTAQHALKAWRRQVNLVERTSSEHPA
jgi:two-component system, sensor histidine kinase and response regulator